MRCRFISIESCRHQTGEQDAEGVCPDHDGDEVDLTGLMESIVDSDEEEDLADSIDVSLSVTASCYRIVFLVRRVHSALPSFIFFILVSPMDSPFLSVCLLAVFRLICRADTGGTRPRPFVARIGYLT